MRRFWHATGWVGVFMFSVCSVYAKSDAVVLHFSDMDSAPYRAVQSSSSPPGPAAAPVPATDWLRQHAWEKIWPRLLFGKNIDLTFHGPAAQRYLRIVADDAYAVWARRLTVDPQRHPLLDITWGVEHFPPGAALDLHGQNDRAIVIIVSFGPEVPSGGLRPNVPRGLALFWGETETVGATYTCIAPRQGPAETRLQCTYPHVRYVALRRGGAGTVHTDQVHLVELFRQHFADYWEAHRHVPPIVAVSFEARSDRTGSVASARLYSLVFRSSRDTVSEQSPR